MKTLVMLSSGAAESPDEAGHAVSADGIVVIFGDVVVLGSTSVPFILIKDIEN